MRKLMALIAVVGFASKALADNHMTQSGSYRLIYTNNANADFNEDAASDAHVKSWNQRTRLNTAIKAGDNMTAQVNLVHNAQWGLNGGNDQYPTVDTTSASNQSHNLLNVNEAYINWAINDQWSARIGQGSFTAGDGTVISANDWEATSKAFTGGLFTYDHEMARIGLFGVEGYATASATDNLSAQFWGLNVDVKSLPDWLKMVNFHYIMVKSNVTTSEADHTRIGVTAKGDTANVDYRATYASLTGDEGDGSGTDDLSVKVGSSMMDAEVGYTMANVKNLRVSLLYHTDSGTDSGTKNKTYQPFHYDRHNNAGLMDVVGWGNLTYQRVGLSMDASDAIKVGADYLIFTATEKADGNVSNGQAALTLADASKDDLGTELDVWVTKTYSSNFSINARYGMFTPGDRLAADGDNNTLMYLEGNLTF